MSASDDYFRLWIESLAAEGIETGDLEADLIGRIGRLRILRDRAIRDMEAARLMSRGARLLTQIQGCHRSTAYRRAERGRHVVATNVTARDKTGI